MPPEPELPTNTIPAWAATIIANVATINARTERLPIIERELDDMRGHQVPLSEHVALQRRTDTLWDAYQRMKGVLWLMGIAQALVAAALAGRIIHIIP